MPSRVSSKNKEKQAKRKNSVKRKRPNRKNDTKKQKTASPGVEPGLSARSSNSLTTAPLSKDIKTIFLWHRR